MLGVSDFCRKFAGENISPTQTDIPHDKQTDCNHCTMPLRTECHIPDHTHRTHDPTTRPTAVGEVGVDIRGQRTHRQGKDERRSQGGRRSQLVRGTTEEQAKGGGSPMDDNRTRRISALCQRQGNRTGSAETRIHQLLQDKTLLHLRRDEGHEVQGRRGECAIRPGHSGMVG